MKKEIDTRKAILRISVDASFAAITSILYLLVKFNLAIFPSFLDINLSMIPVIICTFMMGPWDGLVSVIIRFFIKIMTIGTSTGYVGEFADVLIGAATCIPAGIMYNYTNLKHKTMYSFILVIVSWVLAGIFTNMFINIPFYKSYWHIDNEALANMISKPVHLISFGLIDTTAVTSKTFMFYYIMFAVIPFNLLLSLIVVGVTIPVHKRLKVLYEKYSVKKDIEYNFDDEETNENAHKN